MGHVEVQDIQTAGSIRKMNEKKCYA